MFVAPRFGYWITFLILGTALGAATRPAAGAEPAPPAGRPPGPPPGAARERWSAGAAVIVSRSPYRGDETQVYPVPTLTYRGERFHLLGLGAGYVILPRSSPRVTAVAQYRFSPYDPEDSQALEGMHSRDATLEAGLKAEWRLPRSLELEARALTDTLSSHDGQSLGLQLGRRFNPGAWLCRPSVGVEWLSPPLSRHLYGVGPGEARPGRPAYDPGDTWRAGGGVMLMRGFSTGWATTLMAGGQVYDHRMGNSPIVDKRALWNVMVSVGYRF